MGALLEARIGNLKISIPRQKTGERLFARFSARAVAICAKLEFCGYAGATAKCRFIPPT